MKSQARACKNSPCLKNNYMKIKWDLLEEARKIVNDLNNVSSLIREGKIDEEVLIKYRQTLVNELKWIAKTMEQVQEEIQKEEEKN